MNIIVAANLHCTILMPCHNLVVIKLQAPDPTASINPSEGIVAPPPVCLQGLGNGIENKQTWNNTPSTSELDTLQLIMRQ